MTNFNSNPTTEVAPSRSDATSRHVLFIVGLISALLGAAMVSLVVPQFRNLYQEFGADLPFATRFALSYYHGIWILPILVIAVRFAWPDDRLRPLASLLVGVGGIFACSTALTIALYLPIFKLGSVV